MMRRLLKLAAAPLLAGLTLAVWAVLTEPG
jgi:hypothetical protein